MWARVPRFGHRGGPEVLGAASNAVPYRPGYRVQPRRRRPGAGAGAGQHPPGEDCARRVAAVTAECLVPTVPRQGHGDVAPGLAAHEEGGQLGRVGKGLVVVTTEVGHQVQGIVRRQVDPGVGRAEVPGHRFRVVRLVMPLAGETHREGAHRSRGPGLGQSGDQAGVDAT